jgi:CheY-like chemotaxis protein
VSEIVLVADGDAARGERIAEACRAEGLDVAVTLHGAAALEAALADPPEAVIAQLDLPLIGGERLAEILAANPRTASIGVLFVGGAEGAEEPDGEGRVVPGQTDPQTIARFVQALLARRRHAGAPSRGAASEDGGVEGQLSQLSLPTLLELFHVNRKSGTFELRRRAGRRGETGCVLLHEGDVAAATAGPVEGEKALYRMFSWERGTFVFRPGPVEVASPIDRPTRALLREGCRQLEEAERLSAELPPRHAHVDLKVSRASLPNVLHPLTQEVLLVLELSDRVQDVLDRCSFPDYQVLRTLLTLIRRGIVELRADAAVEPGSGADYFTPAMAARLRDWLDQGRPRGAAPVDAKVLVVASRPEAFSALASQLERLPGAEIAAHTGGGIAHLGRTPVDDEIGIEWIGVPASRRYAPVWPLAAHGALATLVLHADPIEQSIGALRPALAAIGARPRTRLIHLIVREKDPALHGDVVCESPALFEERPVVTLPIEQPERAEGALRELIGRLVS